MSRNHKRPPVREPRHEFGALLDSAFDVQNQLFFGIVWLQGSDIIEQAAETLLLAILAEIVLAVAIYMGCTLDWSKNDDAIIITTMLGGILLAVGVALFIVYFSGKKMLAKEIAAEEKQIVEGK